MKAKSLIICLAIAMGAFSLAGCNTPDAKNNKPNDGTLIVKTENQEEEPDDDNRETPAPDDEKPHGEHHGMPHPDCPGNHKKMPHPRGKRDKDKPIPVPIPSPDEKQ